MFRLTPLDSPKAVIAPLGSPLIAHTKTLPSEELDRYILLPYLSVHEAFRHKYYNQ